MIEYCVVVTFGVLTLTTGPMRDVIFDVADAIRDNFQGYSYAISLSDYPDAANSSDLEAFLISRGVPDEQAQHLSENPFDLMQYLDDYVSGTMPDFQQGLDEIADQAGLSPSDFLEGISPF